MDSKSFWNEAYSDVDSINLSFKEKIESIEPEYKRIYSDALNYFGDLNEKKIIDLGCGKGNSSLYFAFHGATVYAVDYSDVAINYLKEYCSKNSIENVIPICCSAFEINQIEEVDFIFGSMILHHLEPFEEFVQLMNNRIKTGGKGFFWENNANNSLLMWFRKYIVGKLWIPKYGDNEEHPLKPEEIDILRQYFTVEQNFYELYLFRLISKYIFKSKLEKPFEMLDSLFFKLKYFRELSYRQYICLSKNSNNQ